MRTPAPWSATRRKSWNRKSSLASPIRRDEAKMTLVTVEDRPGIAAAIFGPLAEAGVNVDMIVQNISEKNFEGHSVAVTDMTFSCPVNQVARAQKALEDAARRGLDRL